MTTTPPTTTPVTFIERAAAHLGPGRAGLLLGLSALVWGATPVVVQLALPHVGVPLLLALRLSLGLACLAWVRVPAAAWREGAGLGLLLFCFYVPHNQGLLTTSAAKAAFMLGLGTLLLPLLAGRATWRGLATLLLGIAGLAVMLLYPAVNVTVGDAWQALAAVMFALYLLGVSRSAGRHGALVSVRVQLTVMAPLAWLWAAPDLGQLPGLSAGAWLAALFLGVIANGLILPLQSVALGALPPERSAQWLLLEPVFTLGLSALLAGALPAGHELLGGALVLLALWLGTLQRPQPAISAA